MNTRGIVLSLTGALALGASLLCATPALASGGSGPGSQLPSGLANSFQAFVNGPSSATATGLYVTQREGSASANVASFTLGGSDGSLSSPAFAGSGGAESFGIAVTPDGAHVYVTNDNGGSSLSQYSVDPSTGALTPLDPATVTVSASSGAEPEDVAVDPTGRWVYVANPDAGSISQLRIDPTTGALTMVAEFTSELLTFPTGIAFSPDGSSLYAADYGAGNVVEFDVDPNTGALNPKSDPIAAVPQPSGGSQPAPRRLVSAALGGNDYLYVSDNANDQVDEFTIDPSSGELTAGASVASDSGPTGLAVDTATSPASLYAATEESGVLDEYDIDPATGALTPKTDASIAAGDGVDGLALAPDDQELYAGDSGDSYLHLYTIAADGTLSPDPQNDEVAAGAGPSTPVVHALPSAPVAPPTPTDGALSQLPAPDDCITGNPFGCNTLIAPGLGQDYQAVVSPDGTSVYAAAWLGMLVEFSRDPSTGALSEIGCLSDDGGGCTEAPGSDNPRAIALSPDGDYLYEVGSQNELVMFSRDPSSGVLTWIGCLTSPGSADSRCAGTANGLEAPGGIAVSPDGTSVYVTSGDDSSIAWFSRDPSTGLVTQADSGDDCISSDSDADPAGCSIDDAAGLVNPVGVTVSQDGENVYVSAGGLGPEGDVAEFSRDPSSGALTQLASPDDCLGSADSGCGDTSTTGFGGEEDIALSPDGHNAYLNSFSDSAVIELRRDPSSGALSQLPAPNDCITSDSSNPGGCGNTSASALNGVQGVAVSPDGLDLYAASSGPADGSTGGAFDAVDELYRNPVTGALTQAPAPFECLTENGGGCSTDNANGLGQPRRLTVSPDGTNVYVAGQEGTLVELARAAPSADLSIEQNGAATAVTLGDQITYTYTVHDSGPSAADDPVVDVALDGRESLAGDSSSQGSCSGSAPVRCALGPLLSGAVATVTVTADTTATGSASVDATVADATDVNDPDPSNDDTSTTTAISDLAPSNTASPEISGTAADGQTLTASTGNWTGSPTSFDYDWQDCSDSSGNGCVDVQNGTDDQYALGPADDGAFVRVIVTATNDTGHGSATSTGVGPVTGAPTNTALPSISGGDSAGQTLTASPGTWSAYPSPTFTYDWQDCPDATGDGCTTVQSGPDDQYTLAIADEGSYVQVVVSASNGIGPAVAARSAETPVVEGAPVNDGSPSISGSTVAGQTLTASAGTWSGYPSPTFEYVWQDCPDNSGSGCQTVQSGTDDQYTLAVGDEGSLVRVQVTATNAVGSDATAASAFTTAITGAPANIVAPSISGSPGVGQTLTASPGTWSGYPAPSFSYVFEDCPDNSGNGCQTVQSGADDQYTLLAGDGGSLVRVLVSATNGIGSGAMVASAFTGAVTDAPANSSPPTLSGTAAVGDPLVASTGSWSGDPAPSFTYSWQDCPDSSGTGCSTISGAISSTYVPASTDEGFTVRVVVKASNGVGSPVSVASATSAKVTGAPANTVLPSISGNAVAGQTLSVSPGTWTGYPAPAYSYQWQECTDSSGDGCNTVQSGSNSQFTLHTADDGLYLQVVVSASNGIAPDAGATSASVGPVTDAPANTSLPTIAGTVSSGDTLIASPGTWSGYPASSYSYLWQDCPDNSGNGCQTVESGSNDQYTLGVGDEGDLVRVLVTATNGIGSGATADSAFTVAVTGSPADKTAPDDLGHDERRPDADGLTRRLVGVPAARRSPTPGRTAPTPPATAARPSNPAPAASTR